MRHIDHFTGFSSIIEKGKNIVNDLRNLKHKKGSMSDAMING